MTLHVVLHTMDELDALPAGSWIGIVRRSTFEPYVKDEDGTWWNRGGSQQLDPDHLVWGASVLHMPPLSAVEGRSAPWEHVGHHPVQHRDGRAPWCHGCGWSSPVPAQPAVQVRVVGPEGLLAGEAPRAVAEVDTGWRL
jgi:hypothetical protein